MTVAAGTFLVLAFVWAWDPPVDPDVDRVRVYYSRSPVAWCEEFSHIETGEEASTDTPTPAPGELIYVDLASESVDPDRGPSVPLHGPRFAGVCPWRWF